MYLIGVSEWLSFSAKQLPSGNSNTLIIADRNWHSRRTNHKLEFKSQLFNAAIFLYWNIIERGAKHHNP
jgi:hypothetical protein